MCGICGIVNYGKNPKISKEILTEMCSKMVHRGPDDAGVYINSDYAKTASSSKVQVGFGHRRLKIIDLSEAGRQPMSNENGKIWIVFNGEIYNYKNLRIELEKRGHLFKSHTDSETIIHLYEDYGREFVKYLRGMFSFALWDGENETLILARDRIGKKPLLYANFSGAFCFSSEFESLLASGLVQKEINLESIHYYLTFGYIPAPYTIYKNIFKLLPAHILFLKNNEITTSCYWDLDYSRKIRISQEEAQIELMRLLRECVNIRLYSDVPLGAFLSGGIDSSTVVALMNEFQGGRIKTFSIGFEENSYDELKFAQKIADKFGTDHHEFIVKPDALEVLPLLVERYGEPYADSSCIPTYYVSRETKKFVTVALNGDGGDELFAGYERYQAMLAAAVYQRLPYFLRGAIQIAAGLLPDSIEPRAVNRRIKRFLNAAVLPAQDRYLRWIGIFDAVLKSKLYSEKFAESVSRYDPIRFLSPYLGENDRDISIDRLLYLDSKTYLPYDLLVKADIASMINSLEARSPFLDHKLMEFVSSLPAEYKMKNFIKKYLLKKAVTGLLPAENIHRRKMGFGVPVGNWFRRELKELLNDALLSETSLRRNYFNPSVVKGMVMDHLECRADYTYQLWALLMLELWHRRFMDS